MPFESKFFLFFSDGSQFSDLTAESKFFDLFSDGSQATPPNFFFFGLRVEVFRVFLNICAGRHICHFHPISELTAESKFFDLFSDGSQFSDLTAESKFFDLFSDGGELESIQFNSWYTTPFHDWAPKYLRGVLTRSISQERAMGSGPAQAYMPQAQTSGAAPPRTAPGPGPGPGPGLQVPGSGPGPPRPRPRPRSKLQHSKAQAHAHGQY